MFFLSRAALAATLLVLGAAGLGAAAWADSGPGDGGGDDDTTTTARTETHDEDTTTAAVTTPTPAQTAPQQQAAPRPAVTARARQAQPARVRRARPAPRAAAARPAQPPTGRFDGTPRTASQRQRARTDTEASDSVVVTSGDHPRESRSVLFLSPTLARWIAIAAGAVVLIVLSLLAAGFWAKRRVLKL